MTGRATDSHMANGKPLPKTEYWALVVDHTGSPPKFHRLAWGARSREVPNSGWASVCGQEWQPRAYAPYGLMKRVHAEKFAKPCGHCWQVPHE